MAVIDSIKPFWPLLFTFVLSRALGYARAIRVAVRTRPQPRPLSAATRRGLYVLSGSIFLFLLLSIASPLTTTAALVPGYDNVFQTTRSRLQIPTDVLFTRLALVRGANGNGNGNGHGLSEMDEALRTRLTTPALRSLYLRFGPSTLVDCPFCLPEDELSFLLYHLPANVLLPHLAHFFLLALATSAAVVGPAVTGANPYRLHALIGATALLALDIAVLAAYTPYTDGRFGASSSPPAGLFWVSALLRPLGLCVYDALFALAIWAADTGRLVVLSPLLGPRFAAAAAANLDPAAAARRLHESLTATNLALQGAHAKLRAVHVARNAVVRNPRLKDTDDAYWRDVVALQDGAGAGADAISADVWAQVQDDEEVQAALARAYGNGTIDVARMRREADTFVRTLTTALDGT